MSRLSGGWLVGGLAVAILFLIGNGALAYRSTRTLADYEQQIAHTQATLAQLEAVQGSLIDAETGQRGYLLLGDESYLSPYIVARGQLPARLARLRELTADHALQTARLARLSELATVRLDELRRTIELRQEGQETPALDLVRSGTGRAVMDELRTIVATMTAEEEALLAQRTATAAEARRTTDRTLIAATLGEATLLTALALLFWRDARRRERAAQERWNRSVRPARRRRTRCDCATSSSASLRTS